MTMENFTFTGADNKKHSMKRFTDLPAREAEKVLEAIPAIIEMEGENEDTDSIDVMKILPVIKLADGAMRAAFQGTDAKYEKAVNDLTILDKFELFGSWLGDKDETAKKG